MLSGACRMYTEADTCCGSCLPPIYPGPLTVRLSHGSLPSNAETSVTAAAIFLCGQSVRWRCCLLASWHGTHGYLQQQCSLTGKWSRSPSKLSSVSPGSALPDCSDSQSDITKCQPPLPPHPPPPPHSPPKKLTSLIICQAKHYSSWFRSAMLALHSQSISPLSGPKAASLGLIAQPFVPFVCENGKSIRKSSPMSSYHAEPGVWVLQIWNGNQENRESERPLLLEWVSLRNKLTNKFCFFV